MRHDSDTLIVRKKRKVCIPKDLNIVRTWNIIGPIIAQEIGVPDYTPIPNCFDTNAYKIGHIFIPTNTQTTCFRAVPILKILGPIRDFALKNQTNVKWLDKEFHSVQTSGEEMNFRIILEHGKNHVSFTGYDYCFLSKAQDMSIPGNVTINRAAHEDLFSIKWIGLITHVVVTKIFELHIVKDTYARTIYIGDSEHTIFFKYEICEIDKNGVVVNSEMKKIRCKWLPLRDNESNSLPLTEFESMISKT